MKRVEDTMRIMATKQKFTNEQFGRALELYYRGYHTKGNVGEFLCYVFKINDPKLKREDMYADACRYFKETYVKD
jgi:hypothetical protein